MNTILERLEETAARFPERIAVEDTERHYSWKTLMEKAQHAGSCFAKYQSTGRPVVLMTEKSCKTLALMYGALYSGGFYVVIDPEQPAQRLQKILTTLKAQLVVTVKENRSKLAEAGYTGTIVNPDTALRTETDLYMLSDIRRGAHHGDILYAIFTSGSTGEPKGIAVSHEAVDQFITHFTQTFSINEESIIGNQAPFDFDVSVKDIFSSCLTGAKLVLIPRTYFAMPKQLIDYLCDRKINTLIWAVSALCMISQFRCFDYRVPVYLKTVMFSGEVMPLRQLKAWQDALPRTQFVNLYGPSEITCNCTYYRVPEYFQGESLPVGVPFEGRRIFLLDDENKVIDKSNIPGEICVSGESLAIGYLADPDRTAKSFPVMNGTRFYRTGDLGYWGTDGLLYFVGRRDSQIKHMGHRIELGEIEDAMMLQQEIDRACCVFDPKRGRIWGFYQGFMEGTALRNELKKLIPGYMIPNKLVQVEQFELNAHGKIDRGILREKAGI